MEENQDNNENLNNIVNKFNSILKDKDINLGNLFEGENERKNENSEENEENVSSDFNIDIETLIKLKDFFQKMNDNNNPRNRLLYSLKPFLKDSRRKKLDEYIKIANLLVILNVVNDINSLYLILIIIRRKNLLLIFIL